MGHWAEALDRFERGTTLVQPGTALWKAGHAGARRAKTNRDADRKARKGRLLSTVV